MDLKGRDFLTLKDFTPEEISYLLNGSSSYDATAAEEAEFNRLMKKKKAKRKRGFHL